MKKLPRKLEKYQVLLKKPLQNGNLFQVPFCRGHFNSETVLFSLNSLTSVTRSAVIFDSNGFLPFYKYLGIRAYRKSK